MAVLLWFLLQLCVTAYVRTEEPVYPPTTVSANRASLGRGVRQVRDLKRRGQVREGRETSKAREGDR